MNVTQAVRSGTRVELPPGVQRPAEVYVNGVLQREGADYRLEKGSLVFLVAITPLTPAASAVRKIAPTFTGLLI